MEKLNLKLFLLLNHFSGQNALLDKVGVFFARYVIFVFFLVILSAFLRKGNYRKIILWAASAAALGLLVNFAIASFFFHPRPFMLKIGNLLLAHAPSSSFPSRHATFMFAFSFFLIFYPAWRRLGVFLFTISFFSAAARVFCGVHFPFDIVGSFLVGFISSLALFIVFTSLEDKIT